MSQKPSSPDEVAARAHLEHSYSGGLSSIEAEFGQWLSKKDKIKANDMSYIDAATNYGSKTVQERCNRRPRVFRVLRMEVRTLSNLGWDASEVHGLRRHGQLNMC
jgi:hypothetical protein